MTSSSAFFMLNVSAPWLGGNSIRLLRCAWMKGTDEFSVHILAAKNRRAALPNSCYSWSIFSSGSISRLNRYGTLG